LPFIKNRVALSPGTIVRATTAMGTMEVRADDGFGRWYTWEGATRFEVLEPGNSMEPPGLLSGGLGDHWEPHHGITRAVLQEGQQHFDSQEQALEWLQGLTWYPHVHRGDGLVVGWGKCLSRSQLNVDVWQIYIRGEKPSRLPGGHDLNLVVETRE
jgi:hypothetical protein